MFDCSDLRRLTTQKIVWRTTNLYVHEIALSLFDQEYKQSFFLLCVRYLVSGCLVGWYVDLWSENHDSQFWHFVSRRAQRTSQDLACWTHFEYGFVTHLQMITYLILYFENERIQSTHDIVNTICSTILFTTYIERPVFYLSIHY